MLCFFVFAPPPHAAVLSSTFPRFRYYHMTLRTFTISTVALFLFFVFGSRRIGVGVKLERVYDATIFLFVGRNSRGIYWISSNDTPIVPICCAGAPKDDYKERK